MATQTVFFRPRQMVTVDALHAVLLSTGCLIPDVIGLIISLDSPRCPCGQSIRLKCGRPFCDQAKCALIATEQRLGSRLRPDYEPDTIEWRLDCVTAYFARHPTAKVFVPSPDAFQNSFKRSLWHGAARELCQQSPSVTKPVTACHCCFHKFFGGKEDSIECEYGGPDKCPIVSTGYQEDSCFIQHTATRGRVVVISAPGLALENREVRVLLGLKDRSR